MVIEKSRGGDKFQPGLGQFLGDGSEKRLGIAAFEFGKHEEGFEIGSEIEQIARRDLTGHQRTGGAGFFRSIQKAAHLTHAHPLDRIDERGIFGLRLALEGSHHDPCDPGATGALDH